MKIKPIRTEKDYEAALVRIEEIFDAEPDTPAGDELEILSSLVEIYEKKNYPIELPDPIEAIKIRMEDLGLERKDLESAIGSKGRISEILNRKRPLTLPMVQKLSEKLGLPTEVLAQTYPLAKTPRKECRGKRQEASA
ncbi:MAG: helix-turn-helix domain-containing protein [Bacteroidetes bacterium]|nr:helix-turn-helix domain-containing protein [Bacteroidota bacterium]